MSKLTWLARCLTRSHSGNAGRVVSPLTGPSLRPRRREPFVRGVTEEEYTDTVRKAVEELLAPRPSHEEHKFDLDLDRERSSILFMPKTKWMELWEKKTGEPVTFERFRLELTYACMRNQKKIPHPDVLKAAWKYLNDKGIKDVKTAAVQCTVEEGEGRGKGKAEKGVEERVKKEEKEGVERKVEKKEKQGVERKVEKEEKEKERVERKTEKEFGKRVKKKKKEGVERKAEKVATDKERSTVHTRNSMQRAGAGLSQQEDTIQDRISSSKPQRWEESSMRRAAQIEDRKHLHEHQGYSFLNPFRVLKALWDKSHASDFFWSHAEPRQHFGPSAHLPDLFDRRDTLSLLNATDQAGLHRRNPPQRYYDHFHVVDHVRQIEEIIGYEFVDKTLCAEALSFSSRTPIFFEGAVFPLDKNLRLALLGDRVLALAVTEIWWETGLSTAKYDQIFAPVLSRANLSHRSKSLGIHQSILFLNNQAPAISSGKMGEAFEAILGAVYLDSGNELGEVRKVVEKAVIAKDPHILKLWLNRKQVNAERRSWLMKLNLLGQGC